MSWGTHVVLAAEEFVEQRGRALRGEPGRQCAQARGSLDAMEVVVAGAAGLQHQGGHALLDVVLRPAGDLTKVVDAQTVLLVVQRPGRALGQRGSAIGCSTPPTTPSGRSATSMATVTLRSSSPVPGASGCSSSPAAP